MSDFIALGPDNDAGVAFGVIVLLLVLVTFVLRKLVQPSIDRSIKQTLETRHSQPSHRWSKVPARVWEL